MPGEETYKYQMPVHVCEALCANHGFIVHTLCHHCEMVANGGGNLKSCKLRIKVKFNVLVQYSVGFLHLQLIHILALSPQVTVYIAGVLAKNIQVWNQDSLRYRVRLHCKPFSGARLLELWYRVLEALLYLFLAYY